MKLLVAVKRVIDPYVKIRVKTDNTGVETQNVKMAMNPFDEIAVEAALRFKEAGLATEVILVTIGAQTSQEMLRHGLALGADRAILVETQALLCPLSIAKCLKHVVSLESPGLVLMGKQAIDGDNNQTPQMLAGLLNWPQATFASEIKLEGGDAFVTREIDGGLETLKVALPAVISADLRLNEPRYPSLPNIMKSKQKPLQVLALDSLGLNLKSHQEIVSVTAPSVRQGGVKLKTVDELVEKLRHEACVIA